MKKSKTIEVINKYYSLIGSENPTQEEKEFIWYFELELAKSIIQDFGDNSANKLANILLSSTNKEERKNTYGSTYCQSMSKTIPTIYYQSLCERCAEKNGLTYGNNVTHSWIDASTLKIKQDD